MDNFEKNVISLEKGYPYIIDEIRQLDETLDKRKAEIECKNNGDIVLYKIYEGRRWNLNSRYDSQMAAEIYADRYNIQLYVTYFLFGFSDGKCIRELAKKCDETNLIVVCIPDLTDFIVACHYYDLQDIFENERIIFYFQKEDDEEIGLIRQLLNYTKLNLIEFCILPGYDILYHKKCERFMDSIIEWMRNEIVNKATHMAFTRQLPQHMLYHMKKMLPSRNLYQLKQALSAIEGLQDIPVIIVSAGPSLDKNIHLLKQAQKKAFIIAVDASVRTVIKAGVRPDMLCSVDPNAPERFFTGLDLSQIYWACCSWTNRRLMDEIKPEHIFYYGYCGDVWEKVLKENLKYDFPDIASGGSVSIDAFLIALLLGFRKIVLIGQDLAFTGGVSHTKGIEDALGDNDEYIKSRQIVDVEGIDGTILQTDYQMWFYKQWFEKTIRLYKGNVKVIDATEGGAKIEGMEIRTLEDVIRIECTREFDIYEIEQNIPPMFTSNQQVEMLAKLKEMRILIIDFKKDVTDIIKKQEQILIDLKDSTVISKKQSLKKLAEINLVIKKNPILSYISLYAQDEEYEMGDTIYTEQDLTPEQLVEKSLALLRGYQKGAKLFLEDFDEIIIKD